MAVEHKAGGSSEEDGSWEKLAEEERNVIDADYIERVTAGNLEHAAASES